jgi:hypothetical protein
MRQTYKTFVGNSEGKRPLGRPRRRWEDNVRMNIREILWENSDCIYLAQDRDYWQAVMNTVMNLWVKRKFFLL